MLEDLKDILDIQELDMKMLRLLRVKKERLKELQQIEDLRKELRQQLVDKQVEIEEHGKIYCRANRLTSLANKLKVKSSNSNRAMSKKQTNSMHSLRR